MKPSLSFIHIGLPKCASTYLQNVWAFDPQYTSININELMSAARRLALDPAAEAPGYSIKINPQDTGARTPGSKVIASSEGFSWAYCNNPARQKSLDRLHTVSSQILGKSRLCNSILLMVRNPVNYMRSLHEQSIKEGGHEPFDVFFERQRGLIESTINLALIKKAYGQYFKTVVILSADELRNKPEVFWEKYCSVFFVPKPMESSLTNASRGILANKTLGKDKVYFLALLNRHADRIQRMFGNLEDYKTIFPHEFSNIKKAYPYSSTWINRRIAEFSTVEKLSQLSACLKEEKCIQDKFQKIAIDHKLADFIEKNFAEPLDQSNTIDSDTIADYRASLESVVR